MQSFIVKGNAVSFPKTPLYAKSPLIRDISKRDSLLQRVLLCVVVDQIRRQPSEPFGKRKGMKRDRTSLVNSKSLRPLTQRRSFDAAN